MHVSSTYNKGNKIISRLLASILVVFGGVSCSNENSANSNCAAYSLPVTYSIDAKPVYLTASHYKSIQESMPVNFRVIEPYHILASAQFSVMQFQNSTAIYPNIIDVDLRSEYHGFINNIPLTFKVLPNDDINADKSQDLIVQNERHIFTSILPALQQLGIYADNLKAPPDAKSTLVCVPTANAITESDAMAAIHTDYYRITALDHIQPSNVNLDQIVFLYDSKLKNNPKQWIYLHCQGGKGRTTTATAAFVMLKQKEAGNLDDFESIIKYTEKSSNGYKLTPSCLISNVSLECQAKWKRYLTLNSFYSFVNTRAPNELYTQWLIK